MSKNKKVTDLSLIKDLLEARGSKVQFVENGKVVKTEEVEVKHQRPKPKKRQNEK